MPFGALLGAIYGAVISALHVHHNRIEAISDSLIVLANFLVLYGVWITVFFVGAWLVVALWQRLFGSGDLAAALFLGLASFHGLFWLAFFLYGLTYEQTLLVRPGTFPGMVAYLVVAALLIAAVVLATSLGLARWLAGRLTPRSMTIAALLLLAGALASHVGLAVATSSPEPASELPPRPTVEPRDFDVAIVGLDGLDPKVVRRLIDAGELPTLARLVAEGASGELATIPDANSSVIWASMYSGEPPRRHGILDFYRISIPGLERGIFPVHRTWFKELVDFLEPTGLYERHTVTRSDLSAAPVWEVADWAGLSIGLVDGYFYSFPALEVEGPDSFFLSYGADGFARQLEQGGMTLSELELFVQPKEIFPRIQELLPQPDFEWQSQTLLRLLEEREAPRLINLYTHEPDSVQHRFWRWFEPELYGLDADAGSVAERDAIADMHRRFDAFLARLLEQLGDDTALLVVSDHGHVATVVHALDTQHRHGPPGFYLMWGPPFAAGYTVADGHVYDLFPTLMHLLGLPVPEDAEGRVLTEAMEEGFLERSPVRRGPSYRPLGLLRTQGPERSDVLDREEIEKLKALGYI